MKIIVNAADLIVGRMATVVAKKALEGTAVDIINCDLAVMSGNKKNVFARFKQKSDMGAPVKGPFIHRTPERIVRRIIRGMLPYRRPNGLAAFKRVMCYRGVPKVFEGQETVTFDQANVKRLPTLKYVTIKDISKYLGGKYE